MKKSIKYFYTTYLRLVLAILIFSSPGIAKDVEDFADHPKPSQQLVTRIDRREPDEDTFAYLINATTIPAADLRRKLSYSPVNPQNVPPPLFYITHIAMKNQEPVSTDILAHLTNITNDYRIRACHQLSSFGLQMAVFCASVSQILFCILRYGSRNPPFSPQNPSIDDTP